MKATPSGMVNCGGWIERPPETMTFDYDGTAAGDDAAAYMREWYEANRETWWERHGPGAIRFDGGLADDFMLALLLQASVIERARAAWIARPLMAPVVGEKVGTP